MDTKITDTERKELDALLFQRAGIDEKINAILDKYPHCYECGAFEGEPHDANCDCAWCTQCGASMSGKNHCRCDNPVIAEFNLQEATAWIQSK